MTAPPGETCPKQSCVFSISHPQLHFLGHHLTSRLPLATTHDSFPDTWAASLTCPSSCKMPFGPEYCSLCWSLMDQVASQPKNIALAHYPFIQSISSTHSPMAAWKSDQHAVNVLTHSALKKRKQHRIRQQLETKCKHNTSSWSDNDNRPTSVSKNIPTQYPFGLNLPWY